MRARVRGRSSRLPVLLLVASVALLAPGVADAQEAIQGTWELEGAGRSDDRVHLSLRVDREDGHWRSGFSIERDELSGLPADPVAAGDLSFELIRDAGTVHFEGGFHGGSRATGSFTFTPSVAYGRRLGELGFGPLSAERLLLFALQDVGIAYVRGLGDLGYDRLSDEDLFRFVIHDVTLEYIRALADLGYDAVPPEQLVRLRIHDVTPEYVRDVRRALGLR